MKCIICSKQSNGELCEWHSLAYEKLKEAFKLWENATDISWERFLEEVKRNPHTGSWAKEVASHILQKERNQNIEVR